MTLQPLDKTITCHPTTDVADVKENNLSNITPLALSGIFNAIGTEVNSLRVCRSLNSFTISHIKKASINATGRLELSFPRSDRFTRLEQINIHGSPIHPPVIPRYCHLRQLLWNNCIDLQDYELMQISQSKNLELIHLKNTERVTCLGLLTLLNELPKLVSLKIQVPNLDNLSSQDGEKTKKALALKSLNIKLIQEDDNRRYKKDDAFRDETNFSHLIDKIPNLRELSLYKICITVNLIEKILNGLGDLECLKNRAYLCTLSDDLKEGTSNFVGKPLKLINITLNALEENWDDIENSDDITNELLLNLISRSPMLRKLSLKDGYGYCIDCNSQNPLIKSLDNIKYLKAAIEKTESIGYMLEKFTSLTVLKLDLRYLEYEYDLGGCFSSQNNLIHLKLFNYSRGISFKSVVEIAKNSPDLSFLTIKGCSSDINLINNGDEVTGPQENFKSLKNFKINFPIQKGLFTKMMSIMPELSRLAIKGKYDVKDLSQGFEYLNNLQKLNINFVNLDNLLVDSSLHLLGLRSLQINRIYCKPSVIEGLAKFAPNLKSLRMKSNQELSSDFCTAIDEKLPGLDKIKVVLGYDKCTYNQFLINFDRYQESVRQHLKNRKLIVVNRKSGENFERVYQLRPNHILNITLGEFMRRYKQEVYVE